MPYIPSGKRPQTKGNLLKKRVGKTTLKAKRALPLPLTQRKNLGTRDRDRLLEVNQTRRRKSALAPSAGTIILPMSVESIRQQISGKKESAIKLIHTEPHQAMCILAQKSMGNTLLASQCICNLSQMIVTAMHNQMLKTEEKYSKSI
jgi:hypothetical protein